jgi:hypothetical protein
VENLQFLLFCITLPKNRQPAFNPEKLCEKMTESEYNGTRPYNNDEVPSAVERIAENLYFPEIVKFIAPDADINAFADEFKKIKTTDEFQAKFMDMALRKVLATTVKTLTHNGVEHFTDEKSYMFISNHRDIVLDSAILQYILYYNHLKTSEITFGSNLMNPEIVVDLGKMNKMFKIVRGGTPREIFVNSLNVSEYMRYTITEKHQSTWIAQRNGRTKNGIDKTEIAVLKMFAMSSKKNFVENLAELNIAPISVSYEYEPCDFMKTREIYISRRQTYVKQAGEDLLSILHGIQQYKGDTHFSLCMPISVAELEECNLMPADRFKHLAKVIDKRIFEGYKLFKTNYIAHDLRGKKSEFSGNYSAEEKEKFVQYMKQNLSKIEGDKGELREIFLGIYANPVDTKNVILN